MSASPAPTPLGLLEPLKDSSPWENAKIRPMEFPRWNSQHCKACCTGAQDIYGTFHKKYYVALYVLTVGTACGIYKNHFAITAIYQNTRRFL